MVYCIGLTGTIASGKSTVASIFSDAGIQVICSDSIAKSLTEPEEPAFLAIIAHFGEDLKTPKGHLDRRRLRNIIFKTASERLWLERLLHPLIRESIKEKISEASSPYTVIEIPLLYKKTDYPWLNRILAITAADGLAIKRLMQRDHTSKAEAENILALQKKQLNYEDIADDIIVNATTISDLRAEVLRLHQHYLWLSRGTSAPSTFNLGV